MRADVSKQDLKNVPPVQCKALPSWRWKGLSNFWTCLPGWRFLDSFEISIDFLGKEKEGHQEMNTCYSKYGNVIGYVGVKTNNSAGDSLLYVQGITKVLYKTQKLLFLP